MTIAKFKLVTIICEPVLRTSLVATVRDLGASGVTLTEVQGEGSSDKNSGEVPDSKIKIEIISTPGLASKIMEHVAKEYFKDYSLITYSMDIDVIRSGKFERPAK